MQALVSLLFAPWWVFVALAGGAYWLGDFEYNNKLERNAALQSALEQPVPALVDLSEFDRETDIGLANEVYVSGWIDFEADYHLRQTSRSGSVKDERFMYLMFGAGDTLENRQVRGILMLTKAEEANFQEVWVNYLDLENERADGQPNFIFNGFGARSGAFKDMADDAIKELGLTQSPDMIYVEPFFEGREAALTPVKSPEDSRDFFRQIAMWLAGFGIAKFAFRFISGTRTGRKTAKPRNDPFANGPIRGANTLASARLMPEPYGQTERAPQNPQPGLGTSKTGQAGYDPLAAIKQRIVETQPTVRRTDVTPGFVDRIKGLSSKTQMTLAIALGVTVLAFTMPALLGALVPLGIMFWVYTSVTRAAKGAISETVAELFGKKTAPKDDPFSRLGRNL